MIKQLLKTVLLFLTVLATTGFNSTYASDRSARELEHETITSWILSYNQKNVTPDKASAIVDYVHDTAEQFSISPSLLLAMMRVESGFKEKAKSSHGAKGLMQVIPQYHKEKFAGRNPLNPIVSIEVGAWVLKDCMDKHGNNHRKSLNCYSGGGGKQYFDKIRKVQKELQQFILVAASKPKPEPTDLIGVLIASLTN